MSSEPQGFTLSLLWERVKAETSTNTDQNETLETLRRLSSHLSSPLNIKTEPGDSEIVENLALWIAQAILPSSDTVSYDEPLDEPTPQSRLSALILVKEKALHGLTALSSLFKLLPASSTLGASILTCLTAYTSTLDPWTTPKSISLATTLLSSFSHQAYSTKFITTHLLQTFIRPLFAKSKKIESITSSGRKAMLTSAPRARYDASELDRERQPWRYDVIYAVSVFDWAIQHISPSEIISNLQNLLPPLLHLLDATSTLLRHRGLLILPHLLRKMTPQTLTQTGLGSVFEDAVTPTLMFLPSLTPLIESEILLPAAWGVMFVLCDVWFPSDSATLLPFSAASPRDTSSKADMVPLLSPSGLKKINKPITFNSTATKYLTPSPSSKSLTPTTSPNDLTKKRTAFLLTHLRTSLLPAFSYTQPAHPTLTTILLQQLTHLILRLGIYAIKHLKDIIPLASGILTDPFSKMGTIVATLRVLRETLLTSWARIAAEDDGRWRMEILRSLVALWSILRNADLGGAEMGEGMGEVRRELAIVGRLLVKAVEAGDDEVVEEFNGYIERLVEVDKGIGQVFGEDEEEDTSN